MEGLRWDINLINENKALKISRALNIEPIISRILIARGIDTPEKAYYFLNPRFKMLHDPYLLYDMEKAVNRIYKAIKEGEKIYIYGDYDVDGVTSTSLLYECIKLLNGNANYYIPNRLKEGYGLNTGAIKYIHERGGRLIITVDCGISGFKAIDYANKLGVDIIVTDHHEVREKLPNAYAIINPKDYRGDYPFKYMAGVGVAFKLAWALCRKFSNSEKVLPEYREFLLDMMSLVVLGTVADIVPLIDENRIIAKYGLVSLEKSERLGIKALIKVSRLDNISPITTSHIGFRLGPRINAMGRIDNSLECVELLTTNDLQTANNLAQKLDSQNRKRKSIQDRIYKEAKEIIEKKGLNKNKVIVLAEENWHPGVIGIVASKILEEYYRPVLLISLENGYGIGSARSILGFHLFKALHSCNELLDEYGGHELAAGFRIKRENIEEFSKKLNKRADEILKPSHLQPSIKIDSFVKLREVTWSLISQLNLLAPYGEGNPEPILCAKDVEIVKYPPPERYGTIGEHLGFRVKQDNVIFRAIAFGMGELYTKLITSQKCNIAFVPRKNEWNGNLSIQLEIKDIKFI